jgi:hypothetical protein
LTEARDRWPVLPKDAAVPVVDSTRPSAESVQLLYLPAATGIDVDALTPRGEQVVRVNTGDATLVWQVAGRYPSSSARGTIALLDYRSGKPLWRVDEQPPARSEA